MHQNTGASCRVFPWRVTSSQHFIDCPQKMAHPVTLSISRRRRVSSNFKPQFITYIKRIEVEVGVPWSAEPVNLLLVGQDCIALLYLLHLQNKTRFKWIIVFTTYSIFQFSNRNIYEKVYILLGLGIGCNFMINNQLQATDGLLIIISSSHFCSIEY